MGKGHKKTPRLRDPAASVGASSRRRRRLLVIDDDSSVRDTLYVALSRKYNVIGVDSGVAAAEYVKSGKPDLIILDVVLPGKDGFSVRKELRTLDQSSDIPVLFLTALDGHDNILSALAAAGEVFITKPFEMHKLEEMIESLLEISDENREKKAHEAR